MDRIEGRIPVAYTGVDDLDSIISKSGISASEYILIIYEEDFSDGLPAVINSKATLVVSFGCGFKQLNPHVFRVDGEKMDRFSLEYILAFIDNNVDLYNKIIENSRISISLTVEKEPSKLYGNILTFLRRATNAEAGTLYLMNEEHDKIFFVSSQNSRFDSKMIEKREIPFNKNSLVGYVCYKGEMLNIRDAYAIPEDAPYQFNNDIDKKLNYRTVSIITVPMKTTTGNVIGAVQLINKLDTVDGTPIPFSQFDTVLLTSLSTLAAVSVDNNNLLLETEKLLNNMIISSVKAIEQRDPATKGHSIRVAAFTMSILKRAIEREDVRKAFKIDKNTMKTAETAALLHDFGKVGVRERILMKHHRIYPEQLETFKWRLKYILAAVKDGGEKLSVVRELLSKIDDLDIPRPHTDEEKSLIEKAAGISFDIDGENVPLLKPEEFTWLSIRSGTLSAKERADMEKHVVYSYELLNSIDWPFSLKEVPRVAASHHEKLDGSGYPYHKTAESLGIIERVLAIADIYDALTAKDRPYKKAIPPEIAVSIIEKEVAGGKLDPLLFSVFAENREEIDREVAEKTE